MSIEAIFEEFKGKVDKLRSGILNPNTAPSHFTASQLIELGILSMKLDAVINTLKASDGEESDLREALNETIDIERQAKLVVN